MSLTRAQLDAIPCAERSLFVLIAHAANEINVLAKLFHFCAGASPEDPVLIKAQHAQALLLGRLLTGKLFECWQLLQSGYFGAAISKAYNIELDAEAHAAIDAMKRYFSQDNLIARVRNGHAFHYDPLQIDDGYKALSPDDPLDMFLSERNANSLFGFADTIAGRAMLEHIIPGNPEKAFSELILQTSRAVRWVNIVTAALIITCLTRHLGGNSYELGATVIDLDGVPSSQVVDIPYFIEIAEPGNVA